MKCPQCGADTPDTEWNCLSCRVNLYWATQHAEELARIRQDHGLSPVPTTPSFLLKTHENAMDDRADRGGRAEHRVRQIAREVMHQKP